MRKSHKLKLRRGGIGIVAAGLTMFIMVFAMFFLELLHLYDTQYAIEIRAQRAINSTVEMCMDDVYRADGYNIMYGGDDYVPTAGMTTKEVLRRNLKDSLNIDDSGVSRSAMGRKIYTVQYDVNNATYTTGKEVLTNPANKNRAGISIPITFVVHVSYGEMFGNGFFDFTVKNTYASTNFRTDDDVRAGWK